MKNRSHSTLLPIFLAFAMTFPLSAQLSTREVDKLVEDAMDKFNVAGVAVGIVKDGEIVLAKGYGLKSVDTKEKVDEYTSFAIASNSKAFTTAALAILVERGKISWQDRVTDHIPEFKMYNDYVTRNFNIQDLLTHRSGLGLGAGDLQKWPEGSDFTIDDMLVNFQYFKPVSAFRTQYDYDNILYLVAGELIKRVSGMPWEQFVKKNIMDPLGMDHSYTLPPSMVDSDNLASPHLAEDGKLKTISGYELDPEKINGAAGGVLSNASDLCKWMLVHLNEGRYGMQLEHRLFTKESQLEMWKIHTPLKANSNSRYKSHFAGYGLGWRLSDINGTMSVSHTGDYRGMLSKTFMIPDLDLGIVVLTNSYHGGSGLFRAVSQSIADSYLGLDDAGWTDIYLEAYKKRSGGSSFEVERVWEVVENADDSHIRARDYVGIYRDSWFGEVEIYEKAGQLWFASRRSPALTGPMHWYKANAFAIKWLKREIEADAFAIFSLNKEGKAVRISMKGVAPDIDFSYDFQDLDLIRIK